MSLIYSFTIIQCNSVDISLNGNIYIYIYIYIYISYYFFESHLNYCSSIWGCTFLSNIQPIIIVQNRVIK